MQIECLKAYRFRNIDSDCGFCVAQQKAGNDRELGQITEFDRSGCAIALSSPRKDERQHEDGGGTSGHTMG